MIPIKLPIKIFDSGRLVNMIQKYSMRLQLLQSEIECGKIAHLTLPLRHGGTSI
ncbi:MAG: hypothetical protein RIR64_486 [Bacteroidota bacterium]|jgi:hypothetical protein